MSGKGDNPRPFSVPEHVFSNNWDSIFGKKEKEPEPQEPVPANQPV